VAIIQLVNCYPPSIKICNGWQLVLHVLKFERLLNYFPLENKAQQKQQYIQNVKATHKFSSKMWRVDSQVVGPCL
jgi:hypothetical protein